LYARVHEKKMYPSDLSDEEWARLRYVTPADVQDRVGAHLLFAGLSLFVPHLKKIWADGAYGGKELERWLEQRDGWELEVIERDREAEGLRVLPRRWVVERTFGWLSRNRRLAKDYERRVQTSETLIEVATIRLLVRRLARSASASPNTL
jgi:putative transposase